MTEYRVSETEFKKALPRRLDKNTDYWIYPKPTKEESLGTEGSLRTEFKEIDSPVY